MNITVIGIDLAKNTFSLCGLNQNGKVILKKRLTRYKLSIFLRTQKKCLIGIEACGGAHHWARTALNCGHKVKMMHPKYVKPFVKSNKNDDSDALGIAEAALRENIPSVPVKQKWQQDILSLHRIKERLLANRIALSNEARGLLLEYGVTIPQGSANFKAKMALVIDDPDQELSQLLKDQLFELMDEYRDIEKRLEKIKKIIEKISKESEICKKLEKIPGVGPMGSTAIVATAGNGHDFKNGRHFAAWLGLVPKHSGTGGTTKVHGISKRGDRYLRKLMIQGAHAVVRWAEKTESNRSQWIAEKLKNKHKNKVAVAIANKNARIIWTVLSSGEEYNDKIAYAA